jgi:diguanylate cyclase (GGDEF)-like protein
MSSKLVALDLFAWKANTGEHAAILASLVDRLTACIADNALDAAELGTADLRRSLDDFRAKLSARARPADLTGAAAHCLERCESYFVSVQDYLVARDSEFGETIDLLRVALSKLAGDTEGVNDAMDENTRKLKRLSQLNDIRHLRRELSQTVVDLETVVEEKKKLEAATQRKLTAQIAALESKVEQSMAEALKDPLTGVANRRGFDEALHRWVVRGTRSGTTFALAMVDLDGFKRINDDHGHSVGDRILTVAARCMKNGIRSSDFVARYGGEEFVLMFKDIDLERARQRMSEILDKVAAARYEYRGVGRRVVVSFSASCGLTHSVPGEPIDELVKRADGALYEAKSHGKSRVAVKATEPVGDLTTTAS